jgi:ferrous iron transport protein A
MSYKLAKFGKVTSINISSNLHQRLLDIGVIDGTAVECVLKSPSNDPKAYLIRGAVIAIRNDDAKEINIDEVRMNHER